MAASAGINLQMIELMKQMLAQQMGNANGKNNGSKCKEDEEAALEEQRQYVPKFFIKLIKSCSVPTCFHTFSDCDEPKGTEGPLLQVLPFLKIPRRPVALNKGYINTAGNCCICSLCPCPDPPPRPI